MSYVIPYFIYFFSIFISFLISKISNTLRKYSNILVIFLSFLFLGCRGLIGVDWTIYYPLWVACPRLFYPMSEILRFVKSCAYEKGYVWFMIFCKTLSINYFFFQFSIYFIFFISIYRLFRFYIYDYSTLGFLFCLLFGGYLLPIVFLRNCISISLFLISLPYYTNNKIKFIIINVIGTLFHISSIFYFFIFLIFKIKVKDSVILIIWFLGNIIFLLQIPLATIIFTSIINLLFGRVGILVNNYLQSESYATGYGLSIGYIERTVTFLIFFINRKKLNKETDPVFSKMFYMYCIIFLYFSDFRIVVDRIPILIYSCYWILYPILYKNLKKREKEFFLFILLFYSILKLLSLFSYPQYLYENCFFYPMNYNMRLTYTEGIIK